MSDQEVDNRISELIDQLHQHDFDTVIKELHSVSLLVLRVCKRNLTDKEKETLRISMLNAWTVLNEELNRGSPGKNGSVELKVPDSVKTGRFSSQESTNGTRGDVISRLSPTGSVDPLVLVRPYCLESDSGLNKPSKTRYLVFEPTKTKLTKHTFESYTVTVNGSMNFNFHLNDAVLESGIFYIFLPPILVSEDLLNSFIRKGWIAGSDQNIRDMFERVISQRRKSDE